MAICLVPRRDLEDQPKEEDGRHIVAEACKDEQGPKEVRIALSEQEACT